MVYACKGGKKKGKKKPLHTTCNYPGNFNKCFIWSNLNKVPQPRTVWFSAPINVTAMSN